MNESQAAAVVENKSPPEPHGPKLASPGQFLIALGVTSALLVYLLFVPAPPRPVEIDESRKEADAAVEVIGPRLIRMKPGSAIEKKIAITTVRQEKITDPQLVVPGRVVASLRPGKNKDEAFWQFDSTEVLTAFNDWQKARADIGFAEAQLPPIRKLAEVRLEAQKTKVDGLEKAVKNGTGAVNDLMAERATLLQTEITGKKDIQDTITAISLAKRNEAALSRQLQQAGLDTTFLLSVTSDVDIVMADVPEGKLNRVKVGQQCRATFFGVPGEVFTGKVNSIAPVLSKERRSLRVLFMIEDLNDQLRSGMFAEIGIGTDARETLLMPAEGILHIDRGDFALAATENGDWRVTPVQIGEPHLGDVEIMEGLKKGDRVIGRGAILFKPLVIHALATAIGPVENGK